MRWYTLPLVSLALFLATPAFAQQDPATLMQQLRDNMQNAGVNPRDVIQSALQQARDGTFNAQDFQQQLMDNGIISQDMITNLQNMRQNNQQNRGQRVVSVNTLQAQLGATDDEWAILSPKIEKIVTLSNDLAQGTVANNSRITAVVVAGQQQAPGAPASSVATALAELTTLLADVNSPPSDIKIKLTALREAKKQVETQLNTARADLLSLVTLRQEGILLTLAILD